MDAYTHVSADSDSTFQGKKEAPLDTEVFQSSRLQSRAAIDTKPRLLSTRQVDDDRLKATRVDLPLRVEPTALHFDSITPGTLYVMSFAMRNATQIPRRMRVIAPRTKIFSVNYIPAGAVAPGLDYRAEIECLIPEEATEFLFTDKIVVVMDEYQVEVPLAANRPCPDVVFKTRLDFGAISQGEEVTGEVLFENRGKVGGKVKLNVSDSSFLKFETTNFDLDVGEAREIKCTMLAESLGPHRELIMVDVTGAGEPLLLDVSAQVVMHKVNLLYPSGDGIIDNVEVGNMLFGQTKVIKGVLVNNGPMPVAFNVIFPDEQPDDSMPQTETGAPTPGQKFVSIEPSEGVIRAFAEVPVSIEVAPVAPEPEKGFKKDFLNMLQQSIPLNCRPVIDIPEINTKINLGITGTACVPSFSISPSTLRFGQCKVGERRDILVTFENKLDADLGFTMSEPTHFKISPNKGTVYGHQRQTFIATFMPSQMGKIKKIARLNLGDVRSVELRMVGEALPADEKKKIVAGIDKLPEDFKPEYNFVEEKDMRPGAKTDKPGVKSMDSVEFLGSTSWDVLYESTTISLDDDKRQKSGGAYQAELETQKLNRTVYNDFLKTEREKRVLVAKKKTKQRALARGCADRDDPFGVDMGMDHGLVEPTLKIPLANDPLWLLKGKDGAGGGGQRMPFDENRLMSKKYPKQPTTAADMRDCTAELQIEDQRLVSASHTVINYNEICYTSMNWKNFAVTNSLQRPVLITLSQLEGEIKESTPESQVVPAGATAGFDICYNAKEMGKFKRSFMWTVNGQHQHKVSVVGEVIPIELNFDRKHVDMAFADDSLEASVEQEIVLSNPGNAMAEFMMGKAGDFEAIPDQGSVGPGESAMITIRWTPTPQGNLDGSISVHIPGGSDQTISLKGVLLPTAAHFTDRKLDLGEMAVGSSKRLRTKITNTGSNPAVFIFEDGELEQIGVHMTPDRGILEPGETQRVDIQITPPGPMTYNKTVIHCGIRGGKSIKLALAGDALVPTLELQQKNFDFGQIAIGGSHCLPFTITNRSTITANMVLEFDNADFTAATMDKNDKPLPMDRDHGDTVEDADGTSLQYIVKLDPVDGKAAGGMYKIKMPPGVTYTGCAIFAPSTQKSHKFMLPLGIEGLHDNTSLQREITAQGIPSRLSMSTYVSNFGDRVVPRDPTARISFFKEVTIRNVDRNGGPLSFRIEEDSLYDLTANQPGSNGDVIPPIIFVSPTTGELQVGESETIRITFMPTTNTAYKTHLNFFVSDQPSPSRPYLTLGVKGNGIYPRLDFDETRVPMPVVPLGVTSRAQFRVLNAGYDSIDLKYRISPTIPVPLDVHFPDGNALGVAQSSVRVVLAWKSDTATSWVGKIEFYDADGEKFCVEVSGCADNSILSNHQFVETYRDRYGFLQVDNKPITFATKGAIADMIAADNKRKEEQRRKRQLERAKSLGGDTGKLSEGSTASSKKSIPSEPAAPPPVRKSEKEGIDLDRPLKDASDHDLIMLLKWLNTFVCKESIEYSKFPKNIVESGGESAFSCIEQLSGKSLKAIRSAGEDKRGHSRASTAMSTSSGRGGQTPARANTDSRFAATELKLAQHRALVNTLIADGALLNHLNPMALLSEFDYLLAMEMELARSEGARLTGAMLDQRKAQWVKAYADECKYTWTEVLFQSVRVYSLGRVSYKSLKETPGVTIIDPSDMAASTKNDGKKKKKAAPSVPAQYRASNVYGQGEAVLLQWAKYHAGKAQALPDEGAQGPGTRAGGRPKTKSAIDFGEFTDLFSYLQCFHAHVPELTSMEQPLCGYTTGETNKADNNFPKLLAALDAVQQTFDFPKSALTTLRGNFIMLLHLFFTLPTLVPKTTIDFKGMLGEDVVKYIELRNPSKKQIEYEVVLEGSKDFKISGDRKRVVLGPQSMEEYPVTLVPRFSDEVTGRITFWPVRDRGVSGATLVFNLVSKIVGRKPVDIVRETIPLFQHKAMQLKIKNPFDKECTFPISLELTMEDRDIDQTMSTASGKKKKKKAPVRPPKGKSFRDADAAITNEDEADIARLLREPFWSGEDKITLGEGQDYMLTVNALPFSLGTYRCQIVFKDNAKGEFCHEIVLNTEMPVPEKLELSTHVDQSGVPGEQLMKFSSKNSALEKATTYVTEYRLPAAKRIKARGIINNYFAPALQDEDGITDFVMHVDSPFISAPSMFKFVSEYQPYTGPPGKSGTAGGKRTAKQNKTTIEAITNNTSGEVAPNGVKLAFFPERAGVYESRIYVHPFGNERDVRVIDLTTKASMKISNTAIEFRGAARQPLTQEIPVHNDGEEKWELTATVGGAGFSGPAKLVVPAGGSAIATINFLGPYTGQFEGTFILKNPASEVDDAFEYKLVGIAEEPLAEDHLVFKCKARSKETFRVPLKKVGGSGSSGVTFNVETDLPYVSGAPTVDITGPNPVYEFSVNSPVGGVMSGSITFTNAASGAMLWYTVDVEVTSPEAERVISVAADVRTAVAVEIALENPMSETVHFDVVIRGDGLLGNSTYSLGPADTDSAPFELIYSPLREGTFQGSISFVNDQVGEFWYSVNLTANAAPPVDVDLIECMVGDTRGVTLPLENPLGETITYVVQVSDPQHFQVNPDAIQLAPYEQGSFEILFRPSSLTDEEHAEITLTHPALGISHYLVKGRGMMPGNMPPIKVNAVLGEIGSATVHFLNPFPHPLPVDVIYAPTRDDMSQTTATEPQSARTQETGSTLVTTDQDGAPPFALLLRNGKGLVVQAQSSLQIGISFTPERLGVYKGFLQVRSSMGGRTLMWCFPLTGITEVGGIQRWPRMLTQCKSSLIKDVTVNLVGLLGSALVPGESLNVEDFDIDCIIEPSQKKCVKRAFRVQPVEIVAVDSAGPQVNYGIRCRVLFEPLKQLNTTVEVVASSKVRGQWRSQVLLEATAPNPDDVVELVATVGEEDSVNFRLSNRFLGFSQFQAYFELGSSPHFSVEPTTGVLAPYGTAGTTFSVSFAPLEYGTNEKGILTVVTDEAQWSYQVLGHYPALTLQRSPSGRPGK